MLYVGLNPEAREPVDIYFSVPQALLVIETAVENFDLEEVHFEPWRSDKSIFEFKI